MIVVTSPDGTVLRVNGTTTRATGFDADDIVGRPFWESPTIPPERTAIVRDMFSDPSGSTLVHTREADVMTATGERLRVIWNNSLVHDHDGHVVTVVCTGTDVTSERSTSALLRHLLEAPVATALVGLDERGRIVVFNQGAQELLHVSPSEAVGQPISRIVVSPQAELYLAQTEDLADGRHLGPQTSDWTWRTHSGRELTVSTTISVVENAVGTPTGYLCVGRDVTEQRRTQEILVEALEKERHGIERLRRLDAAKNEFVSTVSHELRTPTTSIVGYTEMLRDGSAGEPTEEQIPMLDAIARNGKRLIAVASDLLVLSGLEAGDTSQWEREPVDIGAILDQAEEAILPLLVGRDLAVEFEVPDEPVIGDAAHLDRVLMNLLSNAVKFTPDAGRISCRLSSHDRWAQLEVADTGIGIPEEEQAELFTKFFRSSTAQERAIQGTGLGLSIIDSIVAAHGGDIDVRSAHLQGTTFTVRLPLVRPGGSSGRATSAPGVRTG
jgi:PAS domain S-box-containing protein